MDRQDFLVLLYVDKMKLNLFFVVCFCFTMCKAGDLELSSLTPSKGFRIKGAAANDRSGFSVSTAGDVNGDGIDDIVLGSMNSITYVIFGSKNAGGIADIQLPTTTMAATVGFRILGVSPSDKSGYCVSAAGDVNGDGIGDIIIGAPNAAPSAGADAGITNVVFGRKLGPAGAVFGDIQLPNSIMAPTLGFRILGAAAGHESGTSVSGAGDVNRDGIDDVIVGAHRANPPVGPAAGISYVIYGRNLSVAGVNPFGDIQLPTFAMSSDVGFRILGSAANDYSGFSVSKAGDVNGDGYGDVLVGAPEADPPVGLDGGIAYIIFGHSSNGDIQLTSGGTALVSNIGFRILAAGVDNRNGWSVRAAGDVNGDHIDDIIVGATQADPSSLEANSNAGIAYVIFGRDVPGGANLFGDIQLPSTVMGASVGFRILGSAVSDALGATVSGAGDMNGDGIDDIIVGARYADLPARGGAGVSYVIYGRNLAAVGAVPFGDIQLPTFGNAMVENVGFRILGAAPDDNSGWSVSTAGDVNDDGLADVIVGANWAEPTPDTNAGMSYVILGVSTQPTFRPTSQPSSQPSRQPTLQPSRQPSSQPTRQPSLQPSVSPSAQPSGQPSLLPSRQPSCQPSLQPSVQPSGQPSRQPSNQPTIQPTRLPSAQPSVQPSKQPSSQPTMQPSVQPSWHPSTQPSVQPSCAPSGQPSHQPSIQPSVQPTSRPSVQPSQQPVRAPSTQPSQQPTSQPSSKPSTQPSLQPSSQPTHQPSSMPSVQPSMSPTLQPAARPSVQPSSQPSWQPSLQPSSLPSTQPSAGPSAQPSVQPSCQPLGQPTVQPTLQPIILPSRQPSGIPSTQPSNTPSEKPSVQPTTQPSSRPTSQPSATPSTQPTSLPTTQPYCTPSGQPSSVPSMQPTCLPTAQPNARPSHRPSSLPSVQPSSLPSGKPSTQPSLQPSAQPSKQPTTAPTIQPTDRATSTGEWLAILNHTERLSLFTYAHESFWACGTYHTAEEVILHCYGYDAAGGTLSAQYSFPWTDITSILPSIESSDILISGRAVSADTVSTDIVACTFDNVLLTCTGKTFEKTSFSAGSHVPSVQKMIYIGYYGTELTATIVDVTKNIIDSYTYSTNNMGTLAYSHIQSAPNYVGSFIAGTCTNPTLLHYICAGVIRTDSGIMSSMHLTPSTATILNSADLVNTMALEYVNPDTFIAGGLELSDGAGMHAYLLRINLLYYSVLYGARFRIRTTVPNRRRALQEAPGLNSVVRGMVLVNTDLYMIVDYTVPPIIQSRVAVLATRAATGQIVKQVQVYSHTASISCTDIIVVGQYLKVSCTKITGVDQRQAVLLSIDPQLTLSQLPEGFERYENDTFTAEPVHFYRTMLTTTMQSASRSGTAYSFTTSNNVGSSDTLVPTLSPTRTPSCSPSSQPSGSPTAAPSVSPQPTSQPSSSGPTNTYKPTAKPTQRPSRTPSAGPTLVPSVNPTTTPTARPSIAPSVPPSARPSSRPTVFSTRYPTTKPTRGPSEVKTVVPTNEPSIVPSVLTTDVRANAPTEDKSHLIVGYVAAGLLGLWLLYALRRWCQYKLEGVQSDANRTLYVESMGEKAKPRFPIFTHLVSLFDTIKPVEVDFVTIPSDSTLNGPSTTNATLGMGTNIDGAVNEVDLEANVPSSSKRGDLLTMQEPQQPSSSNQLTPRVGRNTGSEDKSVARSGLPTTEDSPTSDSMDESDSDNQTDVDVILSEESSYYTDFEPSLSADSDRSDVVYSNAHGDSSADQSDTFIVQSEGSQDIEASSMESKSDYESELNSD